MNKKLLLYFGAVAVLLIALVIAANIGVVFTLADNSNYSGTIEVICSYTNVTQISNPTTAATNWTYNLSNANTTMTHAGFWCNATHCNASVDLSGLSDGRGYSIHCNLGNATDTIYGNDTAIDNVAFDSTAPNVSQMNVTWKGNYTKVIGANLSGIVVFNITADDAVMGVDSVYLNISTGGISIAFLKTSNVSNWWNVTLNTSAYADGVYNLTVYANDSQLNNLNNTEYGLIRIDNTDPPIDLVKTGSTANSLTLNIETTDAVSGVHSACTVDRSGATITGTGPTQVLTESGLECSTAYTYVVNCTDVVGNSDIASESFESGVCSGSSGSTTTTTTYKKTYVEDRKEFTEVKTLTHELKAKERVRIKIDGSKHHIGVTEVTATTAKIEVQSVLQTATLSVGDERKFDLTENDYYDLLVKLNSITDGKANITMDSISEEITVETVEVEEKKEEKAASVEEPVVEEEESKIWIWVAVIVVLLLVLAGGGYGVKKRKDSSNKK